MEAGDGELDNDDHEDDGGHLKELAEVDANGAPHEADAKEDGEGDAEECASPLEDTRGVHADGPEEEHGFEAFAEDHEEHEEENAPLSGGIS